MTTGTRYCSGGRPCCAWFATCPRALTEDVQKRADAAKISVLQFIAPTAMPCYRSPNQPEAKAAKHIRNPRVSAMTDADWLDHFNQKPQPTDNVIAGVIRCSIASVRNHRVRLGIPAAVPVGHTRNVKYTKADALKLLKVYRQTKGNLAEAGRRSGLKKNTAKHIFRKWREVFA